MKKIYLIILLLASLFLVSCEYNDEYDVVVSIFPYYSVLKEITEGEVNIKLLSPIGSDIHSYEPTSNDMIAINNARLFIFTDDHVDAWISRAPVSNETVVIDFEDDFKGHHKWTNPLLIIDLIDRSLPTLIDISPENEEMFVKNANSYKEKINALNLELKTLLDGKEIYYAGHNAFDSLEEVCNFKVISLDDSIEPGEITSPQITNLVKQIIKNDVKVLFFEELIENNEAVKIRKLVKSNSNGKIDLKIDLLHGFHNVSLEDYKNNITYVDLLKQNIIKLKGALE